uniref:phospholipase A2 n=1 Tax=Anopheles epiroticus TaxID=199890 RepID=A0A182P616_9DIPT
MHKHFNVTIFEVLCICHFGLHDYFTPIICSSLNLQYVCWMTVLATASNEHSDTAKALYHSLDESGYSPTLVLILQDYMLHLNSTAAIPWSNPAFAYYDQQLIEAIEQQLETESEQDINDHHQHDQLQADHGSPLVPLYGGLKFVTYYCGPGSWSPDGSTVQNAYFSSIDQCCKQHDECPDTIVDPSDYRRYEDLPYKPQLFTRLRCTCDVEFLKCLQNISTFFSYAVAWIYTRFQSTCFDYQHPVMECTIKRNDGLFSTDRCLAYLVDNSYSKRWQWFDIPYLSSNQLIFPELEYRYDLDWFNILFEQSPKEILLDSLEACNFRMKERFGPGFCMTSWMMDKTMEDVLKKKLWMVPHWQQ